MPYNPELHASLPYVDKPYKELLEVLRKRHKRDNKAELEYLISEAAKSEKIKLPS